LEALPKDHVYRAAVEKITLARLDIVRNSVTDVDAEKAIACGQMEELLVQAQDEAALVKKMQSWKAWEPLEVKPAANQWVYFK
jgi:NADH dehydrogenase (ubiquinone) 1 alpha subcomplex subunit 5